MQLFKALDGAKLPVSPSGADHALPLFVPRNGADLPQQLQAIESAHGSVLNAARLANGTWDGMPTSDLELFG